MRSSCLLVAALALASGSLATVSCSRSGVAPAARADAGTPLPPAPARPADIVLEAHLGQPRATVAAVSRLTGARIPFELGLALVLGIDSTVLGASDTAKPIDIIVAGEASHPDVVYVLTPSGQGTFRSTLSGRYRLTPVPGLGERLDPRETTARPIEGMRCAVIGVPGPTPSRLVCANRLAALERAGRFAAYAAQRRSDDATDLFVDVDGATARRSVLPMIRSILQTQTADLSRAAAEARRDHTRPPDFGDPEALLAIVTEFEHNLDAQTGDIRRLVARANVSGTDLSLDTDLTLDPEGRSAVVHDALARIAAPQGHPLATRLAPDSFAVAATRADARSRVAMVNEAIDALVRVLGERLPDATTAAADLHALFEHVNDQAVFGAAREAGGAVETTAVFGQNDGGAGARAVLARLPRAAWLRGLRLGGTAVNLTTRAGAVILRVQAAPTTASRRPATTGASAPATPPDAPRLAVIAVNNDALVVITGTNPEASLAALGPRASGPVPAVFASAPAESAVIAVDVGAMRGGAPTQPATIHGSYSALREGADVHGHGRFVVPGAAIGALRRGAVRARPVEPGRVDPIPLR